MKLYYLKISPPVRAVVLTAKVMELELPLEQLDMLKGEHLTPEYLKLNPMHTVPTLEDDGFVVFDSHAICGYLVSKYGKTDALYPREAKARATVDQRLHFDSGILFARLRAICFPVLTGQLNVVSEEKKEAVREAYDFLDKLLGDSKWIAGNQMTIADICCVASVSALELMVPGLEKFPKASAWLDRCRTQIPGYKEVMQAGLDEFITYFNSKLA